MNFTRKTRLLCLLMVALLAIPSTIATAAKVTTGGSFVTYYNSMDTSDTNGGKISIVGVEDLYSPASGWYEYRHPSGNIVYLLASSLTHVDATPVPTETSGSGSSTATATPAPAATEKLDGVTDSSYTGTIISYTVPTGGLSLYDKMNGSVVQTVTSGTTIKLSAVYKDEVTEITPMAADSSPAKVETGWYSTYYNGKTYYVPESLLLYGDTGTTTVTNSAVRSVVLRTIADDGVTVLTNAVPLYTRTTLDNQYKSGNTLQRGVRINARYYNNEWYSYSLSGTTYYFRSSEIDTAKNSAASVVSNADAELMSVITFTIPMATTGENGSIINGSITLYRTQSTKSTDQVVLTNEDTAKTKDVSLYGVKVDSEWYKVQYGGVIYYVLAADVTGTSQTVVNDNISTNTVWATVGSGGATLYSSATKSDTYKTSITLQAGQNILVSPYNGTFYAYVTKDSNNNAKTYYVLTSELASTTSTNSMSSLKVYFESGTGLYKTIWDNSPQLTLNASSYYVVQSYDDLWYSINYNSSTYYIKKDAKKSSWWVTIKSDEPIFLYDTSSGANAGQIAGTISVMSTSHSPAIPAGALEGSYWYGETVVGGTTYLLLSSEVDHNNSYIGNETSEDYIPTTTKGKSYYVTIALGGAALYVDEGCTTTSNITLASGQVVLATKYTDVLYLVSNGGVNYYLSMRDIASIKSGDDASSASDSSESVSDIIKGETNGSFTTTVLSYTIPTGGLWLYYSTASETGALVLNSGVTVKLTQDAKDGWYTTWYGGRQYYVPASSLTFDLTSGSTANHSILLRKDVDLYTTYACTTKANITLYAGSRANVRAYSYTGSGINRKVNIYATTIGNTTYYFKNAIDEYGQDVVEESLAALVSTSSETSLISYLPFNGSSIKLYTSASLSSSSVTLNDSITSVYGIRHNDSWYKVIYNDGVWYLHVDSVDTAGISQMTIVDGASSTTYTVVIGQTAAKLYTRTTASTTYESGYTLPAGTTIQACAVGNGWYSCTHAGQTLYFQTASTSNANSNASISSYIVTLTNGAALYTTISSSGKAVTSPKLSADGTYTFRTVNSQWASVVVGGITYYVKTADINSSDLDKKIPIATTSIGNSYQITVGENGAKVYNNSSLSGNVIGTLSGGYKTTGIKIYDETLKGTVYKISYGTSSSAYIDANDVSGVASGDEVTEAQQNQQGQNGGSNVSVGSSFLQTLNAGTLLYTSQNTSSSYLTLNATIILKVTKLSASWYSTTYGTATYYLPVSAIETGTNSGGTVSVGDTFSHTVTNGTLYYAEPQNNIEYVDVFLAGTTLTLTKISDSWYETTYNGKKYYIKVIDITLPSNTNPNTNTGTGVTTDGTGIITPYILISPASGSVNLRREANTSSTVLDKIPKGTQVTNNSYTVDKNGQVWYNVTYNGRTGYVIGLYVTAVGTVSGSTSTSSDPSLDIGRSLTVNISSVNVRSGPGTSYSIVGRLEKGTVIVPTAYSVGDSDGMTWYKFQYNSNTVAYIRSDYLAGSVANTSEQSGNVAIKAGDTNLRSGPGTNFGVTAKLARDTIVTIVGSGTDSGNNLWYRVVYENLNGYVRSDLVRQLTTQEQSGLLSSVISQYTDLKYGSKGAEVTALQQQLINLGYLAAGGADGTYGNKTTAAVKAFQSANGMTATGIATASVQYAIFNATTVSSGSTSMLDWYSTGYALINQYKSIQIYDINTGTTWNATYINGSAHADVIPASKADASKLTASNITGSYIRRPVIVTINGQKYAGSMYAVGHGTTNYCSYFSGVMCIHFTGSKTHGSQSVDSDHQAAIQQALNYANSR